MHSTSKLLTVVLACSLLIINITPAFATVDFISSWGTAGTGDSQFGAPLGVGIDSEGNVYIADRGNDRIQKFDSDGNFITKWGSFGNMTGEFDSLEDVEVSENDLVYVMESFNTYGDRIQVFNTDGEFIRQYSNPGTGDGELYYPQFMAFSSNGNLYISDLSSRVQIFDTNFNFIAKFGSVGSGDGQFSSITGMAFDSDDNLYIADYGNDRIQKFDVNGNFITKWGSTGTGNGQFDRTAAIDVTPDGFVYAADRNNDRIQKFTSTGSYIEQWGTSGTGDGEFDYPIGIGISLDGYIYVSDYYNGRIQKFFDADAYTADYPQSSGGGGGGGSSRSKVLPFTDIKNTTFSSYIVALKKAGIVNGYADKTFKPDNFVTRGEFAKVIVKAFKFETQTGYDNFSDVPQGHTFFNEISTLKSLGIVEGYSDGTFKLDNYLTRGEATKFITEALIAKGTNIKFDAVKQYYDVPSENKFYGYISALSNMKSSDDIAVINGYPNGSFKPNYFLTRGQLTKITWNTINLKIELT